MSAGPEHRGCKEIEAVRRYPTVRFVYASWESKLKFLELTKKVYAGRHHVNSQYRCIHELQINAK